MIRFRPALLAVGLSGCLLPLTAGSASASTTIGQNGADTASSCAGGNTFVQTATAPGVPSYAVPDGGGVITSWSFLAGTTAGDQDKLKVFRPTGTANQFFVVGESAPESMTPSALNTFPVRIPVQAGDLLGLFTADGNDCVVPTHTTGNTDAFIAHTDPAPNTTFTGTPESGSGEAYNVRATVEPDADHDGYGDETQDQCPTDASTQGPCPPKPSAPNPVQPPAFGGIKLGSRTLTVKHGAVTVTLACPSTSQGNCVGTDTLATKKNKAKILRLGKHSFSIAPGKRARVTIKLDRAALKLLGKKKTLKVRQTVVAHDSRNLATTTFRNVKLKAPKAHKKR